MSDETKPEQKGSTQLLKELIALTHENMLAELKRPTSYSNLMYPEGHRNMYDKYKKLHVGLIALAEDYCE